MKSGKEFIGLDLLRAAAAIMVLVGHVREFTWFDFGSLPPAQRGLPAELVFGLTREGHEAVIVFFALSGFLVGGRIIAHIQDGTFSLSSYALERATRIFVPLVPACLFAAIVQTLTSTSPPYISSVLGNIFGLNGVFVDTLHADPPLWSLAYEIWFYVAGGAIGYLLIGRKGIVAFTVIALSFAVFTTLDARYLLFWWLGAIAFLFADTRFSFLKIVAGAILSIFGVYFYQFGIQSKTIAATHFVSLPLAELIICAGVCLALPALHSPEMNRLLRRVRRPASFMAGISYTVYLIHYPVLNLLALLTPKLNTFDAASIGLFCVRGLVCLMVALAFYFTFERNTPIVRQALRSVANNLPRTLEERRRALTRPH